MATKLHNQMSGADLHPNAIDGTTGTELTPASQNTYDGRYLRAIGGTITPVANSTTTLKVTKADGTTSVVTLDTTNTRLGIGTGAPLSNLHLTSGQDGTTFTSASMAFGFSTTRNVRKRYPRARCRSGRLAVVVVEQAAEPVAAAHRPVPHGCRERHRAPLRKALVRAGLVVVGGVLGQHAAQVRLAGDEQVVEALLARGADPARRVGVRVGGAIRRADNRHALRREEGVESRREFCIAVVDQVANRRPALLARPGAAARLLGNPGGGRVSRAAGEVAVSATSRIRASLGM